jgi:hypothetical protein
LVLKSSNQSSKVSPISSIDYKHSAVVVPLTLFDSELVLFCLNYLSNDNNWLVYLLYFLLYLFVCIYLLCAPNAFQTRLNRLKVRAVVFVEILPSHSNVHHEQLTILVHSLKKLTQGYEKEEKN